MAVTVPLTFLHVPGLQEGALRQRWGGLNLPRTRSSISVLEDSSSIALRSQPQGVYFEWLSTEGWRANSGEQTVPERMAGVFCDLHARCAGERELAMFKRL